MPRGDEAILRQASGLWAEGAAIRWGQQMRGALGASVRRAKEFGFEAGTPVLGRGVAIGVLVVLLLAIAAYSFRQRGITGSTDAPALPRPEPLAPTPHLSHAALDVQPPRPDAARPYPRAYVVLLSRSIFAVNGVASRRSSSATATTSSPATLSLSLKGITQEDTQFTAFVEDSAANKIFEVRLGDVIGPGRVSEITLHDLTYEVSGNRLRLEIDNVSGRSGPTALVPSTNTPRSNVDSGSDQGGSQTKKKKKSQS